MIAILVLATFGLAPFAGWLVRRDRRAARWIAGWPAVLAVVLGRELWTVGASGARLVGFPWVPSLGLSLTFNLDALGLLFALLIAGIGALVIVYASAYLEDHADAGRFYASLFAFMGAMLGLALGDNIFALFVFWELTGFTSFLLIGFEYEREDARSAALQALIVTGGGGLALLAAGVVLFEISGTASLSAMRSAGALVTAHPLYMAAAVLTLLAAFTKSAQAPFHFWLPNAMAAPTPVSAYLHSATMVKAGVYLLARMTPILGATSLWSITLCVAGAVTMILGSYRSVQETDLKRILAYSTIGALGLMTMLIGVGTDAAIAAALVYLVAHAFYKGALFLVAGGIDHLTGSRDITRVAGLSRSAPLIALAAGAAACSMAGVPLTVGFVGKESVYQALAGAGSWSAWLLVAAVVSSALMGAAGLLAGVLPFRGSPTARVAHAPDWRLVMPPMVLAAAGVSAGLAPALLNGPLTAAAEATLNRASASALAVWHGFTPALMLSALTLIVTAGIYRFRDVVRRAWRPAAGSERLYEHAVLALDATSRAIGPPLHSASLRSYVMAIVVFAMATGFAALSGLPGLGQAGKTDIRVPEVLVIIVIITGAIAAVQAKSTMAAVLALGVVGYGVATMFLLYGAPDLAMTQFSVETLTVLIYVLVFRHFRTLGALSPRLVRARDLLVGAGIGTFIGTLVLCVSTIETAGRLRDYFVQAGPTLAHGRNIVNVILVDFRAFDTMGEITVLATAAIGVRALLRMGSMSAAAPGPPSGPTPSPILQTAARFLMPLLLLYAVFLLWRGHNEPGGGFVGGLVAAGAFSLYVIAYGVERARRALFVRPLTLIGAGLLIALASSLPAALRGQPFLTAQWIDTPVPLGTPMLFDVGVFLLVTGVVLMMIFSLAEEP